MSGVYRREFHWSFRTEAVDVLRAVVVTLLVATSLLFVFKLEDVSRLTLVGFGAGIAVGGLGVRTLRRRGRGEDDPVRVLIVGTHGAGRVIERLSRPVAGARVVGYVGRDTSEVAGLRRLGDLLDLPGVLAGIVVDEVVVCLPVEEWGRLDAIAAVCEEQGKTMRVPVDVVTFTLRRGRVEDLDGVPLLSLVTTPTSQVELVGKRILDVAGSLVALVAVSPLLLVAAIGTLAADGRPLVFSQMRGGLNGRPFRAYKFRTMVRDAEARKAELAGRNERQGPAFKVTDDPRVTPVGRLLRKASIDELPQLWNVLVGDMSLVGPRPQPIEEVHAYDPWHRRRLSVKPGVTGLWQITARNDPDFDRWVDLDLQYIDGWSLWSDLKILARTPLALLRNPGT